MKRRHNEEEEWIKDLPRGLEPKGRFSLEKFWFSSYILQKWMCIRMTARIMMFIPSTDFFLTSGYFTLLYFSCKKERIMLPHCDIVWEKTAQGSTVQRKLLIAPGTKAWWEILIKDVCSILAHTGWLHRHRAYPGSSESLKNLSHK